MPGRTPDPAFFFSMLKDAIDLSAVRRVLVIKLRHHGDVLLSSPVLSVLKNHAPHAEIDALVYHDTRDMLSGHPALSQLYTIDRQWKKLGPYGQFVAEWQLFLALKDRQYDLIVHLTNHKRGAWLVRLLQPRWSVVAAGNYGKWFLNSFTHRHALVPGGRRHTVEVHLDALRRLGIQPGTHERKLTLIPGERAEAQVHDKLAQLGLATGGFILIHPTSRWMFKTWPVSQMALLIDRLTAAGHQVVLTSAPDKEELAMLEQIQGLLKRPVSSLAGQLSLKELAALIARAKLFLGMDSVPMHMAAALQVPTVVLFGPTFSNEWGPWQVRSRVMATEMSCRPCGRDGCGGSKVSECLSMILPDQVFAEIESLLQEVSA